VVEALHERRPRHAVGRDGADQAVLLQGGPALRRDQLDGEAAERSGDLAGLLQTPLLAGAVEAPEGDGLLDVGPELALAGAARQGGERKQSGALEQAAAVDRLAHGESSGVKGIAPATYRFRARPQRPPRPRAVTMAALPAPLPLAMPCCPSPAPW